MALAAAPHIPGFRALSPLGYGPTSTIFSAQSDTLGRWVALTVYSTTLTDDRASRRFQRAFETARRLGAHPHLVTLLDAGVTPERQPYVASENYERGTLEARVGSRPQPLEVDEVLAVGVALAGALETAHRAGVIHGGLHPGRVLIDSNRVPAIADVNLVPLVQGGLAALVGPRHHVPPEVLEGEELTPATDVFSLASTLYMTLTARPPYQGADRESDTAASLLLRMLQRSVEPMGRRDVPSSLEACLAQALDSQAGNRPATAMAFATLLQRIQQELGLPVTDPVVLDIQPGVTLALAGDEPPATNGDHPEPGPGPGPDPGWVLSSQVGDRPRPEGPSSNGNANTNGNGTASGNGTAAEARVFVPYQPEQGPSPLGDVAGFGGFPEPPAPVPVAEPAAHSTVADDPRQKGSSDDWPWNVEQGVETYAPSPSPVAVLDAATSSRPQIAEPPVDDGLEVEPEPKTERPEITAQHARALPVIVLMSLVAVLIVGVGWMILTGQDPESATTDTTQSSAALDEDGAVSPESVTVNENASGVQIDWDGASDEAQVVLVLSQAEAPRALPAETGSALQVDASQLTAGTGYCFAVAPAPQGTPVAADLVAELADDGVGPNACIRGAAPDTVRRS